MLVRTRRAFRLFTMEHFVPSETRMVITEADPLTRVVTEINAEPAGREYARLVGLDVDKLTPMIFAAHPVMVKVGGRYYVRAIQKVNDDGSLTFFCAIDKGLVLTVAKGTDIIRNLADRFAAIRAEIGRPQLVIGCECILRSLELEQKQLKAEAGRLLAAQNIVGFNTFGEQFQSMHVNQTFTGAAIGCGRARRMSETITIKAAAEAVDPARTEPQAQQDHQGPDGSGRARHGLPGQRLFPVPDRDRSRRPGSRANPQP